MSPSMVSMFGLRPGDKITFPSARSGKNITFTEAIGFSSARPQLAFALRFTMAAVTILFAAFGCLQEELKKYR